MAKVELRKLRLPAGELLPVLGQGTWHLGEDHARWSDEVASMRLGLDLGMTVVDTAEAYGPAEELVGEALAGRRDEAFLVSKVLPSNATLHGTVSACERSLRRLRTDHLDLFLLHWRGTVPLEETLEAFTRLCRDGKIRFWGVSNLDQSDMLDLVRLPGGSAVQTDQIPYNLTRRGIEWDLLPWCRQSGIPIMAYSPIEQGRLLSHPTLIEIARRHDAAPAQIALAWVLRLDGILAVPKAGSLAHMRDNRKALDIELSERDLAELDEAFPPPTAARSLETI